MIPLSISLYFFPLKGDAVNDSQAIWIYTPYYGETGCRVAFEKNLFEAILCCHCWPLGWQMVPRQPDQQAATRCSLNPAEMCANAFSKWPLLLYLIVQSSVNLNIIVVCHGEADMACVWELTAAGCLSFAAHLEPCSAGLGLRQRQLSWQWLENIFFPSLPFPSACVRPHPFFFLRGLFFFLRFWTVWHAIPTRHLPYLLSLSLSHRICGKVYSVCLRHLSTLATSSFSCLFISSP